MNVRDERVQAVLAGRRAIREIPFPGDPSITIGIRLLSEAKIDDARLDALEYVEQRAKKADAKLDSLLSHDPDTYSREHERQVLWRALFDYSTRDEKDPAPFFPSMREFREVDGSIVSQLWEHYQDLLDAVDPKLRLTEEQAEELIDALGKGQTEPVLLAQFGPDTLRDLLRITVRRLVT